MDPAKAWQIKRVEIKVGEHYPFYSTLEGLDGYGVRCRLYTGQTVLVVSDETDYESEGYEETKESIYKVRAEDGVEFSAWAGELDDFYFDTAQFYTPEGVWEKTQR